MTPDNIDWVEFTDHAEESLAMVPVSRSSIIDRLKKGAGVFFKDTQNGEWRYDFYLPNHEVAIPFEMQLWDDRGKVAVALTAFVVNDHIGRYHATDRFEFVKKWGRA